MIISISLEGYFDTIRTRSNTIPILLIIIPFLLTKWLLDIYFSEKRVMKIQRIFSKNYPMACIGILTLLALVFIPDLVYYLLCLIFVIMVVFEGSISILWLFSKKKYAMSRNTLKPKVSVHIACYNEPPDMVIQTIKSVLSQDYPSFELIVIDNNTKCEKLWRPIEKFCHTCEKVRFYHLKRWPFYKSGALNFARMLTCPEAEFIFIVDADYQLKTDAVTAAVFNIESPATALVQFPQSYVLNHADHGPILKEFDHYFSYYCKRADYWRGTLATGTLSLIRIDSLDSVGGWPTNSITEDAELGCRFQSAGYDTKYVHKTIGFGIVPIDQNDFLKQRKRWIYGNVQTLVRFPINPSKNFKKWFVGISQLTAWANLMGPPLLSIFLGLMVYLLSRSNKVIDIMNFSYLFLFVFVIAKFIRLSLIDHFSFKGGLKILLTHLSTMEIGAFCWWPVIIGSKLPFEKTNKSKKVSRYRINVFYPLLHTVVLYVAITNNFQFLSLNAALFGTINISSILYDFYIRSGKHGAFSLTLKLQL